MLGIPSEYSHVQVTAENGAASIPDLLRLVKELALFEQSIDSVVATEVDLWRTILGIDIERVVDGTATERKENRRYAECILIYFDDGSPSRTAVGMAVYFYTFSTWTGKGGIYLEDLYISESHRSKGLAKSLFVALGQIASREDLARIDWAVLDWNVGAKKVYTALGATLKSEWEGMRLDGAALKKLIE